MTLESGLRQGAAELGLALDDAQVRRLLDYVGLIAKWNRVYNLTAVRDEHEMLTQHLLDCLAVVGPLRREQGGVGRLLDVGSGAGLPGVVLAIMCPQLQVACVDTVAKKAAFVQQAAAGLGLGNLRGVHARVETIAEPHEVVSSRAFSSLADFVSLTRLALAPGGVWLAMKGKHPQAELEALPADVDVFHVEQLRVPGLGADRCIVWMRASGAAR